MAQRQAYVRPAGELSFKPLTSCEFKTAYTPRECISRYLQNYEAKPGDEFLIEMVDGQYKTVELKHYRVYLPPVSFRIEEVQAKENEL